MTFEIFPTKKYIPKCDEIIQCSRELFLDFLKKELIERDVEIISQEVYVNKEVHIHPVLLTLFENRHTIFKLKEEGEVYVFFHKSTELDEEFWREEIQDNENAQIIKEKIYTNLGIGYSWSVKRTMGQPAIVSLYYGFIAIAIALLTDGIIYSSDGAWDSEYLPIEAIKFKDDYLDLNKISDVIVKKILISG